MNKLQLISAIAEKSGFTKKDSEIALKAFVDVITEQMLAFEKVQLVGFGSFEVVPVAERKGTQQLGENKGMEYVTPAHKSPKFKFSKNIKALVAEK